MGSWARISRLGFDRTKIIVRHTLFNRTLSLQQKLEFRVITTKIGNMARCRLIQDPTNA